MKITVKDLLLYIFAFAFHILYIDMWFLNCNLLNEIYSVFTGFTTTPIELILRYYSFIARFICTYLFVDSFLKYICSVHLFLSDPVFIRFIQQHMDGKSCGQFQFLYMNKSR